MGSVWEAIGKGSPWFFLGTVILAIISGKLVPKSLMEARIKDKNDQIDQWRTAYEMSEESRKTGEKQVDKLLDQGRTTNLLLSTLTKTGGDGKP